MERPYFTGSSPHRWLVASISESQAAGPSSCLPRHQASSDENPLASLLRNLQRRPAVFACHGSVPTDGRRPSPAIVASVSSEAFSTRSSNSQGGVLLVGLDQIFQDSLPQALSSTHHHVIQRLEQISMSTIHWVASWPMWHHHHGGSSGGGGGSDSNRGPVRPSREAARLSELATKAEKEVNYFVEMTHNFFLLS